MNMTIVTGTIYPRKKGEQLIVEQTTNSLKLEFTVSVSKGKDKGYTYYPMIAFGKNAENIAKYFKEGDAICITDSSYTTSSWQKEDGSKGYSHAFAVNRFEFPLRAPNTQFKEQTQGAPASQQQQQNTGFQPQPAGVVNQQSGMQQQPQDPFAGQY